MCKIGDVTVGSKFGKLTVIGPVTRDPNTNKYEVLCRCECGTKRLFSYWNVTSGHTTTCGCSRKPQTKKPKEDAASKELKRAINDAINISKELCYPEWVRTELRNATSEFQISRILNRARNS